MKLAIMQPYFFPYIGYFQLIASADKFVIYDDVNFIKGGWINRNRILVQGQPAYINASLSKASPSKKINEIELLENEIWKKKLIKKIAQSYSKAPFFHEFYPLVERIVQNEEKNLSAYLRNSLIEIMEYLDINTEIIPSSSIYSNASLSGKDRVLDICFKEKAETYINPIGGKILYDPKEFLQHNISLKFIKSKISICYAQMSKEHVPWLSIIDVLMNNSREEGINLLNKFKFE